VLNGTVYVQKSWLFLPSLTAIYQIPRYFSAFIPPANYKKLLMYLQREQILAVQTLVTHRNKSPLHFFLQ
jgi:hypothetical protein